MFVKSGNPTKGDWYIVKVDGRRQPMMWNDYNKFWSSMAGKTYKPEEIDGWFDDAAVQDVPAVVEGEGRIMRAMVTMKVILNDDANLTPKQRKQKMDSVGEEIKKEIWSVVGGHWALHGSVGHEPVVVILPEMKTLGELEEEGSIN